MSSRFLTIKRFKCFEALDLRLENLTVLTGKNSVGKSSITQSIRLLREAATARERPTQIHLNGADFQLGTYNEIINRKSIGDAEGFEIGMSNSEPGCALVVFSPAEVSEECEYVTATPLGIPSLENPSPLHFTYLSAERYGPRLHQEKTNGHRSPKVGVGTKGEYSAEALANNETTRIDGRLVHSALVTSSNALLKTNLEKWMSAIVGEIAGSPHQNSLIFNRLANSLGRAI
jgi:predicted ATPase